MYINFINDRKYLGFMCLRDIKAGEQVTVILGTGVICITIFVNCSLFLNDQDLVDRSYSNRPSRERISNQELNILEDYHNSGTTVQTENGIIFALKQKADDSSFNEELNLLDQYDQLLILAGINDKPSPVQGPSNFPVSPPSGRRPSRPVSGVNPYRTAPKLVPQGLGAGANPAGGGGGAGNAQFDEQDTCPARQKQQPQESNTPNQDLTSKSKKKKKQSQLDELAKPDLPLDAKQKLLENSQLLELSIDPRNGQIDKQSFDEAEYILQTQRETGLFDDARRPNSQKGERDIDFILSGSLYDEADIKTPKSFFDTRKGPKKPIPQDMLDHLAKESGAKSILQKRGSERCLHILDLKDIQPRQKESYKANFLQGAREADPELAKHIIVQND